MEGGKEKVDPGRFRVNIVTFTRSYDLSDQTFVFTVRLIKTLAEFTPRSSRFQPSGYGACRVGRGDKQTGRKKSEGIWGESRSRGFWQGDIGRRGKRRAKWKGEEVNKREGWKGEKSKVGNLEKRKEKEKEKGEKKEMKKFKGE